MAVETGRRTLISWNEKCPKKYKKFALNRVTGIDGIDSLSIDMEERMLTVIGLKDTDIALKKLRKKINSAYLELFDRVSLPFKPKMEKAQKNKTVIFLDKLSDKGKKLALHSAAKIDDIDSLRVDMNEKTLTVMGSANPVRVVESLRNNFNCPQLVCFEDAQLLSLRVHSPNVLDNVKRTVIWLGDKNSTEAALRSVAKIGGCDPVIMKGGMLTVTVRTDPLNMVKLVSKKAGGAKLVYVGPERPPL